VIDIPLCVHLNTYFVKIVSSSFPVYESPSGLRNTAAGSALAADDYQPSELWQVDANGRHPTLLVRCHESFDNQMSTVVAQFLDLKFSPDGRLVYFETPPRMVENTSSAPEVSRVFVVIIL
jgi:hypothetical protein